MFPKKSRIMSLALSATLFFGVLGTANAENIGNGAAILDITNVSRFENAIELTWSGDYNKYEVFANGESIYKGKDNKFKQEDLKADTPVEYLVVALDDNDEILDEVNVEAYTLAAKQNKRLVANKDEKHLDSIRVTTIYKRDSLKFDWDDIAGIEEYEVYKDNEKIGTIEGSQYSEEDLNDGHYEFVGKIEVDDSKKEIIREEAKQQLQRELTAEEEEALFFEYYSIIKSFTPNSEEGKSIASRAALADNTAYSINLKYMTFIPTQYVDNPYFPKADAIVKYFNGNWRGFNPSSYEYKTRTEAQYIFSNKSLDFSKSVASSKFYDSDKKLQYTRTASDTGIYLSDKGRSNTSAKFVVYHKCAIPYYEAITPEIDYNYTAELKSEKGGKIVVYGSHDKAPSHELYYKINGGSYRPIFQHDVVNFNYLFGVYPSWSFNFSN
ncbi:DUF3238 domain-containing protein [Brevibacillus reuszeri]|uniref:DUF3238 domain-containing protein n=1 Tax=Brevibacillus reuszeri TaxID=54915 RepID=UPI0028A11ED3|nr:DUF3238 domain-containing protein [Brevibacillus reuszeri]